MVNILAAIVLFFLYTTDAWGAADTWLLWAVVNLVIGCAFVIGDRR